MFLQESKFLARESTIDALSFGTRTDNEIDGNLRKDLSGTEAEVKIDGLFLRKIRLEWKRISKFIEKFTRFIWNGNGYRNSWKIFRKIYLERKRILKLMILP